MPTRMLSQLLQAPTIVVLNLWSPDTPEQKYLQKCFQKIFYIPGKIFLWHSVLATLHQ